MFRKIYKFIFKFILIIKMYVFIYEVLNMLIEIFFLDILKYLLLLLFIVKFFCNEKIFIY